MGISACIYAFGLVFGNKICPFYDKLTASEKTYFSASCLAILHACYVGYWGARAALETEIWTSGNVTYSNPQTNHICEVFLGYMSFDSLLILYFNKDWGGWNTFFTYCLHHGAALPSYFMAVTQGVGHPCCIMGAVAEISTPLLHFKWCFEKNDQRNTLPYVINGVLFAVAFFCLRICLATWIAYHFIYLANDQLWDLGTDKVIIFYITYGVALGLQYYWFIKIVKGLYKGVSAFLKGDKKKAA